MNKFIKENKTYLSRDVGTVAHPEPKQCEFEGNIKKVFMIEEFNKNTKKKKGLPPVKVSNYTPSTDYKEPTRA